MEYSKKCTLSQLHGYIGESYVQYRLCKAGCSVNSLIASDFGIDLHIQLPDLGKDWVIPTPIGNQEQGSWAMLPEFVHIQVKFTGDGVVSISRDEVQEWIETSRTGLPTFLFLVREEEGGSEEIRYFDPGEMRSALNAIDSEDNISFKCKEGTIFDDDLVLTEMLLYARYPLLMQSFSVYPTEDKKLTSLVDEFISQVGVGVFIDEDAGSFNESVDWGNTSASDVMEWLAEFVENLHHPLLGEPFDVNRYFMDYSEFERLYSNVTNGLPPRREGEYSNLPSEFFASRSGSYEDALMGLIRNWELRERLSGH